MPLPAIAAALARVAGPIAARVGPSLARALGTGGSAASQAAAAGTQAAAKGSLAEALAGATSQAGPTAAAIEGKAGTAAAQLAGKPPLSAAPGKTLAQFTSSGSATGGASAGAKPSLDLGNVADLASSLGGNFGGGSAGSGSGAGAGPGGGGGSTGGGSGGAGGAGGAGGGSGGGAGSAGAGGSGGGPPGPGPSPSPSPSRGPFGNWLMNNGPSAYRVFQHSLAIGSRLGQHAVNSVAGGPEQRVFSEAAEALERIGRADFRVLLEMPANMKRWAEELLNGRRALAQYNSSLASTFAKSEVRGIRRDIESGERTAGTTANLSDALDDLKDTVQPYGDAVTNALQAVVAGQLRIYNAVTKLAPVIIPAAGHIKLIADWFNRFGPKTSAESGFTAFLESAEKRLSDPFLDPPLDRRHRPFR